LIRFSEDIRATVNPNAVVVLGNQKSGTTAIACLIAKASDSSLTNDFLFRYPFSERRILKGENSLSSFVKRHPSCWAKDIVKEPGLSFHIPEIKDSFRSKRIVFVLRDPIENTRSILNRLGLSGDLGPQKNRFYEDLEIRFNPEWRDVVEGKLFGHGDPIPSCSLVKRALMCEQISIENQSDLIIVSYKKFCENKKEYIESLCGRLGLPVCNDIRSCVDVQYQPPGKMVDNWEKFFGSRNLSLILEIVRRYKPEYIL
tara:strand:+ start:2647 stop:3417 length:771 start_codon:yes stop_codon:yes gene_type:complete